MATTVTLDSEMVSEIKSMTGARTKTEAVRQALTEYIRARKRRELLEIAGRVRLRFTNAELEDFEAEESDS